MVKATSDYQHGKMFTYSHTELHVNCIETSGWVEFDLLTKK